MADENDKDDDDPGYVPASDLEPIAGVSLETYARVSRAAANDGVDALEMARGHGLDEDAWAAAHEGWRTRFHGNMPLSVRFASLYEAAAGPDAT